MKTTSTYGATLIDQMGSDLSVVNAARVSFHKESGWETITETRWDDGFFGSIPYQLSYDQLPERDTKLIAYLARNGHWTPFAHAMVSFRVKAPLFVARQLQKHQVGLAWNEVSRRYVDEEPEFYVPYDWRKKADNAKQGSSDELVHTIKGSAGYGPYHWAEQLTSRAVSCYQDMLNSGVCPEQARMVLPQSMMTEWIWSGSVAAFARVCNQRLHPHAQKECGPVASDIDKAMGEAFPVSWEALRTTIATSSETPA